MKIKFQQNIDKNLMVGIVKFFHPLLVLSVIEEKIKYKPHGNYNWVMIMFSVTNYGRIALGICNHETTECVFSPITRKYVSRLFKKKCIIYNI